MGVRVKICGLTRPEDAERAARLGARYLGVILSAGFGRSVSPEEAGRVLRGREAVAVAVLVDEPLDAVLASARAVGAGVIQLHGREPASLLRALRSEGDWALWKSVRARSLTDVRDAVERYGAVADGILVEGWKEGVVGGGGARLALEPASVRAAVPSDLDFVLAGGLGPDNVAEAVALFRPDVVDVSSGVETRRREKDPHLMRAFIEGALGPDGEAPTLEGGQESEIEK